MRVHVEGNLYILSDERQFILSEERERTVKDDDGNEIGKEKYFFNLGYYGTLTSAARAAMTRKIKDSTATNLTELVADVNRIYEEVEKVLKGA